MYSDEQPLFESAPGAKNQAAGDQQTPEATGSNNEQFIQGWDYLSPSSMFFQQASEQAAQSVGSFIRRPMDLPPQQVGQGVHTPVISRASGVISSVLARFDQEPIPVQPLRTSGIMVGSGDLSPPAVGDVRGATGPDPDTQAHLAQKAVEADSTQVASPLAHSSDFPPPPNGPQRPDVGQGGDRSPVPSYEQALQAQVASLQAQLAAATAATTDGHTGPPMGEVGAPPPPPPPLRQDVFSRGTGVPPVVSGAGVHPAPSGALLGPIPLQQVVVILGFPPRLWLRFGHALMMVSRRWATSDHRCLRLRWHLS